MVFASTGVKFLYPSFATLGSAEPIASIPGSGLATAKNESCSHQTLLPNNRMANCCSPSGSYANASACRRIGSINGCDGETLTLFPVFIWVAVSGSIHRKSRTT